MEAISALAALGALAQETRLTLFRYLVEAGPQGVPAGSLTERFGLPAPTLSFHLAQLKHAGLVSCQRHGRLQIYAATISTMTALIGYLTVQCCASDPRACGLPETAAQTRSPAMTATIYHNPTCGTSRNVLAALRDAGLNPTVIEYLKTPPSREAIQSLADAMGVPLRAILREKGTPYAELGLGNPELTDAQLLDAIAAHPILLNRPIVVTAKGTKLCRPTETVAALLP